MCGMDDFVIDRIVDYVTDDLIQIEPKIDTGASDWFNFTSAASCMSGYLEVDSTAEGVE